MPMLASTMMAGPRRMLTRPRGDMQQTLREPPPRAIEANGRSPEDIKREREEAQRMMAEGSDYSPIQHWSQGVARVFNAGLGAWQDARLRREEAANRKGSTDKIAAILAGLDPNTGTLAGASPMGGNVTAQYGSASPPQVDAPQTDGPGTHTHAVVYGQPGQQQPQASGGQSLDPKQRAIIEAMMDPWLTDLQRSALQPLAARAMETPDAQRKRALEMQRLEREAAGATDDQRNYDWAVRNGYKGSPMDYMTTLRRSGVTPLPAQIPGTAFNVDAAGNIVPSAGPATPQPGAPMPAPGATPPTGSARFDQPSTEAPAFQPPAPSTPQGVSNLVPLTGDALKRANLGSPPTGKQWGINPQTGQPGLMQIEGFQSEIPGEIAARFGLSADFFKDADFIEQQIEKGVTSGIKNQGKLALGMGEAGQVWRLASDGSDAMQRLLTGAGMPASEAKNYVDRFLPTVGDSKATQLDKVRNLTRRLKAIVETAGRGRIPPEEIKRILGVTGVGDRRPGDAPASPPPEAVQMLGPNPSQQTRQQFDEIFGPGAADKIVPPTGPAGGPLMDAPPSFVTAPTDPDPYQLQDITRRREEMQRRPHHRRMLTRP